MYAGGPGFDHLLLHFFLLGRITFLLPTSTRPTPIVCSDAVTKMLPSSFSCGVSPLFLCGGQLSVPAQLIMQRSCNQCYTMARAELHFKPPFSRHRIADAGDITHATTIHAFNKHLRSLHFDARGRSTTKPHLKCLFGAIW